MRRWPLSTLQIAVIIVWLSPASAFSFEQCFKDAAAHYPEIDINLLKAIAFTESCFVEKAVSAPNKNGSVDIGVMQINSSWLPLLSQYGIHRNDLLDACTNINIGTWVLAQNIQRLGKRWKAVGAYNARSEAVQLAYIKRVHMAYSRLRKHEFNVSGFLSGKACSAPRKGRPKSSPLIRPATGKAFVRISADIR
jgi:Transglycosylase SLT domain